MSPVSTEERERIVEALRSGLSQNAVARQCGRGVGTINRIARGTDLEYSAPEKAADARRDYCQAERLQLLNEGFDKARDLLESIKAPNELQQWSMAVAILTDKRRLEDGEATSRAEVNDTRSDARARLTGRLDELAARRDARRAAG